MFSIRRNWGMMGRIFGVPRAILSRICAFCSSWTVDGNLVKLTIPEFPDPEKNPIRLSIDEDALLALIGDGSGTVTSVDGKSPDATGAVSFGLTASRPVVTDADGHLASLSAPGVNKNSSANLYIVTSVTWDASHHVLKVVRNKLVIENGIITAIGADSPTNIQTTLVTWV